MDGEYYLKYYLVLLFHGLYDYILFNKEDTF